MREWRTAVFSAFVCLPAALLVVGGGWLVSANVPRLAKNEPSRIGREYRDVAEDLIADPAKAPNVGARMPGWRQTSRIGGVPWGYSVKGDRVTVWFKSGEKEWRWLEREAIRPFPYELVFYGGGTAVAAVVVWMTVLTLLCFRRFEREREDFLSATAHDLKTPLVGMRRLIGRDDEAAKRLNERLLLVVNNVLDFMRLGCRRRDPQPTCFDIVAACREAYRLFAYDYEDDELPCGPVEIDVSRLGSDAVAVEADETLTMQILWNLFGNDLKYAAPYGRVTVRISREADLAVVEFADEGQGMSPEQMRHAFDRYYRARTVLESGKGGFGIGLCTALEFARSMRGDLAVRANEPKGCVFTLKLPLAAV